VLRVQIGAHRYPARLPPQLILQAANLPPALGVCARGARGAPF
jgi:hypothetical protein